MEDLLEATKLVKKLSPQERHYFLVSLMFDGTLSITEAITAYSEYLERFKRDAQNDIRNLSQAGLSLADKQINKIPLIKNPNVRQLALAQTKSLLDGGGYSGSEYQKHLTEKLDFTEIDADWYENTWAIKTTLKAK